MKKTKLLIIGSGGHAKSCIEIIENIQKFKIMGLIDSKKNKTINKYKVIFSDNEIMKIKSISKNLVLGLGSVDNTNKRAEIFERYKKLGFHFPTIIAKGATVSKNSKIGEGTIIFNHVLINSGASIGEDCIINNKTLIEHDVKIGDHAHISTNVTINGNCKIGEKAFLGSGTILKNNLVVSKKSFIKMGSVIKTNQ